MNVGFSFEYFELRFAFELSQKIIASAILNILT